MSLNKNRMLFAAAGVSGGSLRGPYTVFAIGKNWPWRLGTGNATSYSSPVQIGAVTEWLKLASGGACNNAVKTDGTLWAWGDNGDNGEMGTGNTTDYDSPIQVGSDTDWVDVGHSNGANYGGFGMGLKSDGVLWAWGRNAFSGFGNGNTTSSLSPVVTLATGIVSFDVGHWATSAWKADGSLWVWGWNGDGLLGINSTTAANSPVQVGATGDWIKASMGKSMSAFVKNDYTLWTTGDANQGKRGSNDAIDRSSPHQVGALTDWADVRCGYWNSIALKTDGTLWSWGRGAEGINGINSVIDISSPTQVGALTDWAYLGHSVGRKQWHVIKTDGTLWSWGLNTSGQLGDGTIISRSSPVQIGALTDWKSSTGGDEHSIIMK